MDKDQLERNLNSVGKACFVEFYDIFFNLQKYSHSEAAEILIKNTNYTDKSCNSRVSHARAIIRANLGKRALELIVNSRAADPVIEKARELIRTQNGS
ncbi:hypothetical protein [Methylomonas fluvii]|uniref:Uncharacterized protein n=1 Tax=Methylomonas fluvii TaxID=1854564 RepID=A0ABR9DEA9_9GAMM|nr:hypothetical protein [Methylomonas fluvii]MBD9361437.1 hypothetical protein [Methylomonas fluvii]